MRSDGVWSDVRIRNASSRGMMVETADPPERGAYIEIRRGALTVIGRVAWSRGRRFGFRSQDKIDVDALMAHASQNPKAAARQDESHERRKDPSRLGETLKGEARSRQIASALQYVVFGVAAIIAAIIAATMVGEVLSRPFQSISNALGH
ncbi:hypothetical protein C1T17_07995 [Sphingobium sp. SCG-1]|nr:hypothetical protein C1T17_07995 [Sphingobium sp. SCG-1]